MDISDGFDDITFQFDDFEPSSAAIEFTDFQDVGDDTRGGGTHHFDGHDIVHKRGLKSNVDKLIRLVTYLLNNDKSHHRRTQWFSEFMVLSIYGKRNMPKASVNISKLNVSELEVYKRIRRELSNTDRKLRIFKFINQKDITKRLINYFVVHYILVQRPIAYYLDKRTYPYTILGEFNNPHQTHILKLKEQGHNIVWINLHQEYKTSKNKKGRRNLHAPYARSISVKGEDSCDYSLCELNFYIWLDDMGGFEAFFKFEEDIRDKKSRYDEEKRLNDTSNRIGNGKGKGKRKRKKRKIVLKNTDGRNYKTFIVNFEQSPPFSSLRTASHKQIFNSLVQKPIL
jgi:hypothetical protein